MWIAMVLVWFLPTCHTQARMMRCQGNGWVAQSFLWLKISHFRKQWRGKVALRIQLAGSTG